MAARRNRVERRIRIAQAATTGCFENGEGILCCGIALFRRHSVPTGGLWPVLATPEALCIGASHIVLRGGEALRRREAEKMHGLRGVPRHAATAFVDHPQVILTRRIASFGIGPARLVGRESVPALFRGFGGSKIGGNRPDPQHE